MALFATSFWGEKHGGFDVLCQNLKQGEQSCKDLEDFVKQCYSVEDQYVKLLARLIKSVGSYSSGGSFAPVWQTVKISLEKLSQVHIDLSKSWQDLLKDIHKYMEGLAKKFKASKDSQSSTLETVQSMQQISTTLAKSKETYIAKFNDYKKVLTDKNTTKKVEKSDADFKKATEDYKSCVLKYNSVLEDYKTKMTESAAHFQEIESDFLTHMVEFVKRQADARQTKHVEIGELYHQFHISITELTVDKLCEKFVENKRTGTEPPEPVEFEEADIASLPPPPSPPEETGDSLSADRKSLPETSTSAGGSSMMHLTIPGIFRKKKRTKKVDSGKDSDSTKDNDSLETQDKTAGNNHAEVDEEGYTIRKETQAKEEDMSDSTSDSDSDDDRRRSKLKVEIRPLPKSDESSPAMTFNNISLKLNATQHPANQLSRPSSTSSNLISPLDNGPVNQSDRRVTTPVSWTNIPLAESGSLSAEDKEVFDTWKGSVTNNSNASSSLTIPGLPRPPSRKDIHSGRLSAGRVSPGGFVMARNESFGTQALQTFAGSAGNGESRPIAVAMTEVIQAQFRGSEHTSKVQGDIMVSFPASMLEIADSAETPTLTFRIAGRSEDQVKVNTQLVRSEGDLHSFKTEELYTFLKARQAESLGASYFNVNVAKYMLTTTAVPLNLTAYWKCEPEQTDFRLDYEYVGGAMCKPLPLTKLTFLVPINGQVTSVQSQPSGTWSSEHSKMLWSLDELKSGTESKGSLKGRFQLSDGPSSPSSVAAAFTCEGTILSGTEFELATRHYKVSFTKKRMCGKFLVDTDKLVTYV